MQRPMELNDYMLEIPCNGEFRTDGILSFYPNSPLQRVRSFGRRFLEGSDRSDDLWVDPHRCPQWYKKLETQDLSLTVS